MAPAVRRREAAVHVRRGLVGYDAGMLRIGIISDTHLPSNIRDLDELGPETGRFLAGVDLILHSGDVVLPSVLDWCERIGPVMCSSGGHDHLTHGDERCARVQVVEQDGWRLGMVHDIEAIPPSVHNVADLQRVAYGREDLHILVSGDSHYERIAYREGVLLLDSGSPVFPHHKSTRLGSAALIELSPGRMHAEIVVLGQTPGLPNPCTPAHITIEDGQVVSASVGGVATDRPGWRPSMAPPLRV